MKRALNILVLIVSTIAGDFALGFPEMIRHGYPNCITCHVSPNGGGLITPYGRALSQEVLSTWTTENESAFLWSTVELPDWINAGGDFRAVQTRLDTPSYRSGKWVIMQADAEMAISNGEFTVLATIGKSHDSDPPKFIDHFMSRRHYVIYHPQEEIYLRAGRFQKAFGINLPDHIVSTKQGLGWNYGSETYNLEASWIDADKDLFLTGVFGRPDNSDLDREKGVATRAGFNVGENHKAGMSYFYGDKSTASRHVFGPYALLGFRKDLFLLAEVDFQNNRPDGETPTWGWANYGRFDYEVVQGLHVFLAQDLIKSDFRDSLSLSQSFGGGIQFFPRPHFEFLGSYQKQRNLRVSADYNDFFWAMMHFYL
ncbi:MAG: hypothetical protein EBR01_04405 [Proteobacteria bacterium]|nr:hypothetical protein [Pseudomonadota bacterium]